MSIRPNRVKQRLAAGQVATILAGTNDPDMIDQLGPLHPDGIWLEGEHGGVDYADLGNLTRACDLWGMTSVVRVMDNDYATIYRTLDRGAQGIVVPHVNSRAEAQMVVEAGKFAPLGKRGMFTSRQGFGVSLRTLDIMRGEPPVDRNGLAIQLSAFVRRFFESSLSHSLNQLLSRASR